MLLCSYRFPQNVVICENLYDEKLLYTSYLLMRSVFEVLLPNLSDNTNVQSLRYHQYKSDFEPLPHQQGKEKE